MSKVCEHGSREEYCVAEAAQVDGDGQVVIDTLDALLYETEGVRNDYFGLENHVVCRAFSFMEQLSSDGPMIQRALTIQHDISARQIRDAYNVQIEWWPLVPGAVDEEFVVVYAIDRYAGSIQACIEQPSITTNEDGELVECREQRYLTPYDYVQLFDVLEMFNRRHDRERKVAQAAIARAEDEETE